MKELAIAIAVVQAACSSPAHASEVEWGVKHSHQPCFAGENVPAWDAFNGGWQVEEWVEQEWERFLEANGYKPGKEQGKREQGDLG